MFDDSFVAATTSRAARAAPRDARGVGAAAGAPIARAGIEVGARRAVSGAGAQRERSIRVTQERRTIFLKTRERR